MSVNFPLHVAVIMDGNGRWAKQRNLPRIAGHQAGLEAVRKIVQACIENKHIKILTLFAFSSENWSRPKAEISGLMLLFIQALKAEVKKLHEHQIQLKIIGNLSRLNQKLQTAIHSAVELTQHNQGMTLMIAVDYSGQWDILQATQKIGDAVRKGEKNLQDITAGYFKTQLSTGDLPDPDLLIRTSGEQRISNFLLWQLAYTELYFTAEYWPDFTEKTFQAALDFYKNRIRRFGGL